MVYETQHAIGIKTETGIEILLHIGIDTVMLGGTPFDTKVQVGDHVQPGDLLTDVYKRQEFKLMILTAKRDYCSPSFHVIR